ncbi:MAG: DUF1501 domain-containing protein [Archangiaceae bacterium]|nr:DUF1501 domain-containing protein [Archangiaceae bacterium]
MSLFSRRALLVGGGLSLAFASRARAREPSARKALVVVFLRGGVDGLAMVAPVGDPQYAGLRPTLREEQAVVLDGFFALHPAMASLAPLYEQKRLAVVHAVGQLKASRSHFDAQDFLESGLAGQKGSDGWLNRALSLLPASESAFRGVAVQNGVPYSMVGAQPVVAFPSLRDFKVGGGAAAGFEQLYAAAVDEALRVRGAEAFTGLQAVKGLASAEPRNGAQYPKSGLGKRLQDVARLIHGDVGLQLAATEDGGFDTHLGQKQALNGKLRALAEALAAFAVDLGDRLDDVAVVTVTEFGRTARENGTRGTDHGTASALLAFGGGIVGGRVVSDWPGLSASALHEGRDLRVTLDVRTVLAELLSTHLQILSERSLPGVVASRTLFG